MKRSTISSISPPGFLEELVLKIHSVPTSPTWQHAAQAGLGWHRLGMGWHQPPLMEKPFLFI